MKEKIVIEDIQQILEPMGKVTSGDLIPILQQVQRRYGYLPQDVLLEISKRTSIAASTIYGVATFYEQFYLEPHGRHTVKCCRGTACHVRDGQKLISAIERVLGIEQGQTTEDMEFSFETVACLGTCALAPVMMVDEVYHGKMTPRLVEKIIDNLRSSKEEAC